MYRARPVVPLLVRLIVNRLKAVGGLQNYGLFDQTQLDSAAVREAMHHVQGGEYGWIGKISAKKPLPGISTTLVTLLQLQ